MMHIAAFDSGVGGLTTLGPLFRAYPGLKVTYFGDLANLPYGTKSKELIRELTSKNLHWLLYKSSAAKQEVDLVVIACNTASAHALGVAQEVSKQKNIPCVGVIEAGCNAALKTKRKRIVVLATAATVQSGSYLKTLGELNNEVPIVQKACPLFVSLVEEGLSQSPATDWIVKHYLDPILQENDAAILGCTHYPYLLSALSRIYPSVEWIDAGGALVHDLSVQKILQKPNAAPERKASLTIYLSDRSTSYERLIDFMKVLNMDDIECKLEYVLPII